ncbi:hypothetical protein L2X98_29745 [Microbacterium elymi]|uniref:Uncharacterized protein n=1 Tax=Microbacterium elymi TaxID=2909587 RepID=A0ABY5NHP0_9MICO|nr:hypothetical protein [Microbacterium elymi]UUT34668.1 hypothetical protein L2X98_29745 [Microbacterium elymi]
MKLAADPCPSAFHASSGSTKPLRRMRVSASASATTVSNTTMLLTSLISAPAPLAPHRMTSDATVRKRLDAGEDLGIAAGRDAERTVDGCLLRTSDRRIDEEASPFPCCRPHSRRHLDRDRGQIHDHGARARVREDPAVAENDRLNVRAAGKGEEDDVGAARHFGDGPCPGGADRDEASDGFRRHVEHTDRQPRLPRQVRRLAGSHHTEPDEAELLDLRGGHAFLASAAALVPAIRPNTAPRTRPAPAP